MKPFDPEQQTFVDAIANQRNMFANQAAMHHAGELQLTQQLQAILVEMEALKMEIDALPNKRAASMKAERGNSDGII